MFNDRSDGSVLKHSEHFDDFYQGIGNQLIFNAICLGYCCRCSFFSFGTSSEAETWHEKSNDLH